MNVNDNTVSLESRQQIPRTYFVSFVCTKQQPPRAVPGLCSVHQAQKLLRSPSFVASFAVLVPRSTPLGCCRDVLDALQCRNGGRSSISKDGKISFRAVYDFDVHEPAERKSEINALTKGNVNDCKSSSHGENREDPKIIEAHSKWVIKNSFSDQAFDQQQSMLESMFDLSSETKRHENLKWIPISSIRVMPSKQQKIPHNQRAELFMWQSFHGLKHHTHQPLWVTEDKNEILEGSSTFLSICHSLSKEHFGKLRVPCIVKPSNCKKRDVIHDSQIADVTAST